MLNNRIFWLIRRHQEAEGMQNREERLWKVDVCVFHRDASFCYCSQNSLWRLYGRVMEFPFKVAVATWHRAQSIIRMSVCLTVWL